MREYSRNGGSTATSILLGISSQKMAFTFPRHLEVGLFDDVCFAGRRSLDEPDRIEADDVDQS